MGILYGRAGRLNTKNAGFRPGQGDKTYGTMTGNSYTGAGYILRNTSKLMQRDANRSSEGNELYTFAHSRPNFDDLFATGWVSSQTAGIFHDFTLYSAKADAYVNLRLFLEIKARHQIWVPMKHVRVLW